MRLRSSDSNKSKPHRSLQSFLQKVDMERRAKVAAIIQEMIKEVQLLYDETGAETVIWIENPDRTSKFVIATSSFIRKVCQNAN